MGKTLTKKEPTNPYISPKNASQLCNPLGACLAFKGIEGSVPFLQGYQGCATYIGHDLISDFGEPLALDSSSLTQKYVVNSRSSNRKKGILNIRKKYGSKVIGIASTCLRKIIGNVKDRFLKESKEKFSDREIPILVNESTLSYRETHGIVRANTKTLCPCS